MLGIVGFVRETSEEEDFVADECKAVAQTGARGIARERWLWTKLLPLPFCGLKLFTGFIVLYKYCTRLLDVSTHLKLV